MNALDESRKCADVAIFKPAFPAMGNRFEHIARLDILKAIHDGTKQVLCFFGLDAPHKVRVIMNSLGTEPLRGEAVLGLVADRSLQWAAFKDRSYAWRQRVR
jgi:hypothetical protein